MSIQRVTQKAHRATQIWLTDVTVSTSGMNILIGGTAIVPDGPGGPQKTYQLSATIPFIPPSSGADHHVVAITWNGTLVVDPAPTRTDLAGYVCWFDLPAGTTDLANIDIYQLVHEDIGGGAVA